MTKFNNILKLYSDWAWEIFNHPVELQWGATFGCYPEPDPEDSLIEIGMTMAEDHVADLPAFFSKHFVQHYNMSDVHICVLNFLHECGHIKTAASLTPEQRAEQAAGRSNPNITFDEYRLLPGEYKADHWANHYLNAQPVAWKYYQSRLQEAYAAVTEADLTVYAKGELND